MAKVKGIRYHSIMNKESRLMIKAIARYNNDYDFLQLWNTAMVLLAKNPHLITDVASINAAAAAPKYEVGDMVWIYEHANQCGKKHSAVVTKVKGNEANRRYEVMDSSGIHTTLHYFMKPME